MGVLISIETPKGGIILEVTGNRFFVKQEGRKEIVKKSVKKSSRRA
jgi:hypothetical protein